MIASDQQRWPLMHVLLCSTLGLQGLQCCVTQAPTAPQASEDCLAANGRLPWLHDVARQEMQTSRSASPTLSLRDAPAGALSLRGQGCTGCCPQAGAPSQLPAA